MGNYNLCDEAGYLARQVLKQNGVSVTSDCVTPQQKPVAAVKNLVRQIIGLVVYPNPASEKLTIYCPNENLSSIRLFDLMGRVVIQLGQGVGQHEAFISVRNIKPGIYCLEAVSENGKVEKLKIVIQH